MFWYQELNYVCSSLSTFLFCLWKSSKYADGQYELELIRHCQEDLRGDITTGMWVFKTKRLQSLWKAIFQHTWTMTKKTQGRVSGCLLFCRKHAMQYRFSKAHDQSRLSDHTALRLSPGYTLKTHNQACLLFPQVWVFGLSHLVWFSSSEVEL